MKQIVLFTLLFFIVILMKAQPLSTRSVEVKNTIICQDTLYFEALNRLLYKKISKQQNDSLEIVNGWTNSVYIPMNMKTCFIVGGDTMSVNLIFYKYSPIRFEIERLHFKKGDFTIQLKECTKEYFNRDSIPIPIVIKDFPCDCMVFRKKEEEND